MKFNYNLVMIDTADSVQVLETLLSYGKDGWRFVGWVDKIPPSVPIPHLKYGIFEKEII